MKHQTIFKGKTHLNNEVIVIAVNCETKNELLVLKDFLAGMNSDNYQS